MNEAKSDEYIALVFHGKTHPKDVWILAHECVIICVKGGMIVRV